jgi:predicted  nucleic acid-binding Zn-ribbon protein
MPLTGHLNADFTDFQNAVDASTVKLKSFESGAASVEKQLSRMADSFTGQKIVQEATLMAAAIEKVGGVATLTGDELARAGETMEAAIAKLHATNEKIPPDIQAIADAAKTAEGSWGSFVKGFDIGDAIEHPLQTAQQGMGALAESIGPTAVAVVGIGAAAIVAGKEIFEFAEQTAKADAAVQDMSERTGMTVGSLSQYSSAATVAGSSLDTLGDAFFKLTKGMGENSDIVEKGLNRIGLSTEQLKAVGPDHYLELIADGLAATTDPAERAAADAEIFRDKTGNLIPVLLKMHDALAMTADTHILTPEEAHNAEQFDMQIASLKVHAEDFAQTLVRPLIPAMTEFIGLASQGAKLAADYAVYTPWGATMHALGEEFGWASAAWDTFRGTVNLPIKFPVAETEDMTDKLWRLATSQQAVEGHWKALSEWESKHAATAASDATAIANLADMQKNLDVETQKHIDLWTAVNSVGATYQETLDKLSGTVVEGIKYYIQAGLEQSKIAALYGVTTEQVKAEADAIKDETEALKDNAKFLEVVKKFHDEEVGKTNKELQKQAEENLKIAQATNAQILANFEAQTKLNAAQGLDAKGAIQLQTDAYTTAMKALDALHAKKVEGISQTAQENLIEQQFTDTIYAQAIAADKAEQQKIDASNRSTEAQKSNLEQVADKAATTYQRALNDYTKYSQAQLEQLRDDANAAAQAVSDAAARAAQHADDAFKSFHNTIVLDTTDLQTLNQELSKFYDQLAAQGNVGTWGPGQSVGTPGGQYSGPRVPKFGEGGSGDFGSGTIVELHGKEAIVPLDDDSASNILYGGSAGRAGGGSVIYQTINITQPLGTPDAIARAVGDANVALMKGQGIRLPYGT